ncbi:MAG: UDP-N-acetylmuramoylalanyl-D-glutamyl-2,6-diaminopimelate--D-alanyl-D-alanine ligase [Rhizobiaceae bacterium]
MSLLWKSEAMVAAMDGRPVGVLPDGVTGLSIDSRTLKQGEAFFAIKGDKFDGHDFATAAMAGGAGLLVVSEARLPALGRLKVPMIVVDDVLGGLERLAAAARKRSKAKIIAVTGSVGKTTTKEMLRHILAPSGTVHASVKSFNNHWGVPLTLARMPGDTDFGVFEIGMNHAGEIRPLVRLVKPHIAIVTLIAAAHLGHFKNLAEIADAKAEIFEGVVRGGHALINRDDGRWKRLEKAARAAGVHNILGFGAHRQAVVKLLKYEAGADGGHARIRLDGKSRDIVIGAPGRHIAQNALAALGAARLAGADMDKAIAALAGFEAEAGRGRRITLKHPRGEMILIDESYNANPASMAAALELLKNAPVSARGRRIAVLGDMLELGSHSARLHAGLAGAVAEAEAEQVFLGGEEMAALSTSLPDGIRSEYRASAGDLCDLVINAVRPGDAIMIKSSNGIGFSKIVDALVKRYPPVKAKAEV